MKDVLAATTWETLDVEGAWRSLDHSITHLETPKQIQVVGRAIEHLVELFVTSSEQVFEELDATLTHEGPVMTIEQFAPFVRQSMEIDFSPFVCGFDHDTERRPYAPRIVGSDEGEAEQSVVAVVDAATLADAVEGLKSAVEEEIDREAALSLAHGEDVESWTRTILVYFEQTEVQTVSLQILQRSLNLPWIELWLGLLLGGYRLERRGEDFYGGEIWVRNRLTETPHAEVEQVEG